MLEEILNIECNRTAENIFTMYIYKDGNSPWYRAYELSAYYAFFYKNGLDDSERLHPTKKASRILGDGMISVGLKLESFKKYFPNLAIEHIDSDTVEITVDETYYDEIKPETYKEIYGEWKTKFEIKKAKSKNGEPNKIQNKNIYNSPVSFSSIMREILKYDTNGKSEEDLRRHIYILKEMCANLI